MNLRMIGENLMKLCYHTKNYSNLNIEDITDSDYNHAKKKSVNILK